MSAEPEYLYSSSHRPSQRHIARPDLPPEYRHLVVAREAYCGTFYVTVAALPMNIRHKLDRLPVCKNCARLYAQATEAVSQ